jgi:lipopolysaccharide transport system ATP-binding protein
MSDTAIKFENISKQYRLGTIGTGTLSHDLNRWWTVSIQGKEDPYLKVGQVNDREVKSTSNYVWALKDIDVEVKKGEVLGIIGKNGAGKSTLLKILSRVTKPTTGRILARGRIASLLEVGTGFHPEMTGRENIFMNGSIMGMTKVEIRRKFDEIVDFAGVDKYIDTPVKRYSSGMTVRLGFAIAAHMEPEILVVDEVLAVGDAEFQKKAIGKMQDVSHHGGRTVLFVSHNMAAVSKLCNKAILLSNGKIIMESGVDNVIDSYISMSHQNDFYEMSNSQPETSVYFERIFLSRDSHLASNTFSITDPIYCIFELNGIRLENDATLTFIVRDKDLQPIFSEHFLISEYKGRYIAQIPGNFLLPGNYFIQSMLHIPNKIFLDNIEGYIKFSIEETGSKNWIYNAELGHVNVKIKWGKE